MATSNPPQPPKGKQSEILPRVSRLHQRHPGLDESAAGFMAGAASVAFSRHHEPPQQLQVTSDHGSGARLLSWDIPEKSTQRTHGNKDDATEQGAYGVAIAAIENEMGLLTFGRMPPTSGGDWYVVPEPTAKGEELDLENAYKLEVSGLDSPSTAAIRDRLRQKLKQVSNGASDPMCIACVVAFEPKVVIMKTAAGE